MTKINKWPAWCVGPGGEGKVFVSPDDLPKGWVTARENMESASIAPTPFPSVTLKDLGYTRSEAMDILDEEGVTYAGNIKNVDLAVLLKEVLEEDDDGA